MSLITTWNFGQIARCTWYTTCITGIQNKKSNSVPGSNIELLCQSPCKLHRDSVLDDFLRFRLFNDLRFMHSLVFQVSHRINVWERLLLKCFFENPEIFTASNKSPAIAVLFTQRLRPVQTMRTLHPKDQRPGPMMNRFWAPTANILSGSPVIAGCERMDYSLTWLPIVATSTLYKFVCRNHFCNFNWSAAKSWTFRRFFLLKSPMLHTVKLPRLRLWISRPEKPAKGFANKLLAPTRSLVEKLYVEVQVRMKLKRIVL